MNPYRLGTIVICLRMDSQPHFYFIRGEAHPLSGVQFSMLILYNPHFKNTVFDSPDRLFLEREESSLAELLLQLSQMKDSIRKRNTSLDTYVCGYRQRLFSDYYLKSNPRFHPLLDYIAQPKNPKFQHPPDDVIARAQRLQKIIYQELEGNGLSVLNTLPTTGL